MDEVGGGRVHERKLKENGRSSRERLASKQPGQQKVCRVEKHMGVGGDLDAGGVAKQRRARGKERALSAAEEAFRTWKVPWQKDGGPKENGE